MEVVEPQTPTTPPTKRPVGRPKGTGNGTGAGGGRQLIRNRQIARQLRTGQTQTIDKAWLLAELMGMYTDGDLKGRDRLSCLDMIAKITGYTGKNIEEPEDERKALQQLMQELENGGS